jgi:hypothetical protein
MKMFIPLLSRMGHLVDWVRSCPNVGSLRQSIEMTAKTARNGGISFKRFASFKIAYNVHGLAQWR